LDSFFLPPPFFFSPGEKYIRASKSAVTSFPDCRVSRGKIEIRIVGGASRAAAERPRENRKRVSIESNRSFPSSDFIIAAPRLPRLVERHFNGRSIG